jgi:hypothetical protein
MYSYLTFKATRTPKIIKSGRALNCAITEAASMYEQSKILSDHGLLASGVCVVVMTDEDAADAVSSEFLPEGKSLVYQCGGW